MSVQATFALVAAKSAATPFITQGIHLAGAGFTTDAEIALRFQRVRRQLMQLAVVEDLLAAPLQYGLVAQGVEWSLGLPPQLSEGFIMIPADAVYPYIMVSQHRLQRLYLVYVAAEIRVGGKVRGALGVVLQLRAYN